MECNKCKKKGIYKKVNNKLWCDKCLTNFLKTKEARKHIIATIKQ